MIFVVTNQDFCAKNKELLHQLLSVMETNVLIRPNVGKIYTRAACGDFLVTLRQNHDCLGFDCYEIWIVHQTDTFSVLKRGQILMWIFLITYVDICM